MRETLLNMLTYGRPAGSVTEGVFRRRYLLNLPGAWTDVFKNIHVEIGTAPRTLWSCHTDTVHRKQGRQAIRVKDGRIVLAPGSTSTCLGADDTVGVYLARERILAGKPGYYLFHHGEEQGGIGSSALARGYGSWLAQRFDHAIALDRRNTSDVITHQAGGRCASDVFARALADALNHDTGLTYAPSPEGIYTDTAEYVDHVAECTNLSVGYSREHSSVESVDLRHVDRLLGALLDLDTSTLPVVRTPGDWGWDDDDRPRGRSLSLWSEDVKDYGHLDPDTLEWIEGPDADTEEDEGPAVRTSAYATRADRFDRWDERTGVDAPWWDKHYRSH